MATTLVVKLSRKLAMCYARGQYWNKKANCGKSARQNIEITLLKVHFRIWKYIFK